MKIRKTRHKNLSKGKYCVISVTALSLLLRKKGASRRTVGS